MPPEPPPSPPKKPSDRPSIGADGLSRPRGVIARRPDGSVPQLQLVERGTAATMADDYTTIHARIDEFAPSDHCIVSSCRSVVLVDRGVMQQ